jgi:DNA-binding NarL/FixJ family response regulator
LRQLAQGHTNEQIAQHLFISVSTVKKHVRQIISKLGVSDRTHAAILAIKHGLSSEQDV